MTRVSTTGGAVCENPGTDLNDGQLTDMDLRSFEAAQLGQEEGDLKLTHGHQVSYLKALLASNKTEG